MSTPWPTYKEIQLNKKLNKHVQKKVHIRYDTINGGNCFTLAARSVEAKISLLKTSPLSFRVYRSQKTQVKMFEILCGRILEENLTLLPMQ